MLSYILGCVTNFAPFPATPCPVPQASAGAQLTTITHDGVNRSWYTYVPASVANDLVYVPLVINLHGIYACAVDQQERDGWLSKAEEFGFILVWPQATNEPVGENGLTWGARWNAGMCDVCLCENCVFKGQSIPSCCQVNATLHATGVPNNDVDDVAFLREVVMQVVAAHPIDTTRVYFAGLSYGCFMAQRMLAEASDMVAAVACFAGGVTLANGDGVYPLTELSPRYTPRPLMVIHGNADVIVSYEPAVFGYQSAPYSNPGAKQNLALWGGYNGCPGDTATETLNENYTLHEVDCNGVVSVLVEVPGVGHYPFYIPGGVGYDGLPSATFDTTQLAWDFLKAASIACPTGCVSSNARQRRWLLFGSFPDSCPKGCIPA